MKGEELELGLYLQKGKHFCLTILTCLISFRYKDLNNFQIRVIGILIINIPLFNISSIKGLNH